jgi:hypothetical protein
MLSVAMLLHHVQACYHALASRGHPGLAVTQLCLGCSGRNIGGQSPWATVPCCHSHLALCRSAPPALPAPRCCSWVSLGRSHVSPSKLLRCPLLVVLGDALLPRSMSIMSMPAPAPLLAGRWLPTHATLSTACHARLGDPILIAEGTANPPLSYATVATGPTLCFRCG